MPLLYLIYFFLQWRRNLKCVNNRKIVAGELIIFDYMSVRASQPLYWMARYDIRKARYLSEQVLRQIWVHTDCPQTFKWQCTCSNNLRSNQLPLCAPSWSCAGSSGVGATYYSGCGGGVGIYHIVLSHLDHLPHFFSCVTII